MIDHGQVTDPTPTRTFRTPDEVVARLDRIADRDKARQQREQAEQDHAVAMMTRYLNNAHKRQQRGDIKGAAMNVRAAARYAERIH